MKIINIIVSLLLSIIYQNSLSIASDLSLTKNPILKLNPSMHYAPIRKIAKANGSEYLISASEDKTIKIWNTSTLELIRTIRIPIGPNDEGKIYSLAVSPDGETIAVGGWTQFLSGMTQISPNGFNLYIFNRTKGKMIKKIGGFDGPITHVVFSKDGMKMAVCMASGGLKVFNTTNFAFDMKDDNYGADSYGADFDINGRLVTACFDGYLRLYDSDLNLISKKKGGKGLKPYSVSFSPQGEKIAVGYYDKSPSIVEVISGNDLSLIYQADTSEIATGCFNNVIWSSDGNILIGGGEAELSSGSFPIRMWSKQGMGLYKDLIVDNLNDIILDIVPEKNGGFYWASGEPSFGYVDNTNKTVFLKTPQSIDYKNKFKKISVSNDGSEIALRLSCIKKPDLFFSFNTRLLSENPISKDATIRPPKIISDTINISEWEGTPSPKVNGKPIKLESDEISRSLSISNDENSFALGSEWFLHLYNASGSEKWKIKTPGTAWGVNFSGNGKFVVAGFGDGTIRWFRTLDGREILSLFLYEDKDEWIAWTPDGYYDTSPGAETLIGWHVNNGEDADANFFELSLLRREFYRPNLLMNSLNSETNIKQNNIVNKELPPVAKIEHPTSDSIITSEKLSINYSIFCPSGSPIKTIKILADGRALFSNTDLNLQPDSDNYVKGQVDVEIPTKTTHISLVAANNTFTSDSDDIRLIWNNNNHQTDLNKPRLFVLAIGVSGYQNSNLALDFPAKDAADFCDVIKLQEGLIYSKMYTKIITNSNATKDNIINGLSWIQAQANSHDVSMLFLSGHGINGSNGDYYFLPVDTDMSNYEQTGVIFSDFKKTMANIKGKVFFFIDSCHSENIIKMGKTRNIYIEDINSIINELSSAENGVIVFASSKNNQYSYENKKWNNSAFTKALVEGLNGNIHNCQNNKISIKSLGAYVIERVEEITNNKQNPVIMKPDTIPDLPIAVKITPALKTSF